MEVSSLLSLAGVPLTKMRMQLGEQERFVNGADGKLYTAVFGDRTRPALVFTHGGLVSSACWSMLLGDLSKRFCVFLWDLPGHGASGKPQDPSAYRSPSWAKNLRAVLESLGLAEGEHPPVFLAGWSYGGYVMRDYLQIYGQQGLAGLVFVAPFLDSGILSALDAEAGQIMMGTADPRADVCNPATIRFVTELLTLDALPIEVIRQFSGDAALVPVFARGPMVLSLPAGDGDLVPFLQGLELPVLYIQGEQDRLTPLAYSRDRIQHMNGELRVYSGCGHMPFLEKTREFLSDLEQFTQGCI